MKPEEEKGRDQTRVRYVWDHDKLAWVQREEPAKITRPPRQDTSPARGTVAVTADAEVGARGLEYIGAWTRLIALAIDLMPLGIVLGIISFTTGFVLPAWGPFVIGLVYLFSFVGFWSWRGQTPGKMAIGAKIVRADGKPVGFGTAFLRYLGYLVPFIAPLELSLFSNVDAPYLYLLVGALAFVIVAWDSKKRGLHDMIARTYVVRSR